MIQLTRLNGSFMVVNSDLIKYAEASPDTMLTLINGEKIIVLESCEQVVERIVDYRARLLGQVESCWPADLATRASLASAGSALRASNACRCCRPDAAELEPDQEGAQRRRRPE